MKNKLKTIGLVIGGMLLAVLLWAAYAAYYQAIYNKGYNEAVELTNAYIDLNNVIVEQCDTSPARCGYTIKEVLERTPKFLKR